MFVALAAALGALVAGALGWLGVRRARRHAAPVIDPFTVGDPWRRHLMNAQAVQIRYRELVGGAAAGPLRERMTSFGGQLDRAIAECLVIARQGDELDRTIRQLDPAALGRAEQRTTSEVERASLRNQLAGVEELRRLREQADGKLREATTRMGELLSEAAQVRVGAASSETELDAAVEDVVTNLHALRQAVEDVQRVEAPRSLPGT